MVSGLYEVREAGGTAGLIVPHPPHTPSGKVLTAQCIDGTSVAAPYPNNTSGTCASGALGGLGEGFLLSTKVVGRSEKNAVKNS